MLSDSIIELTTYKSHNDYPVQLRRVEYYDEEQDRYFVFLTNAMDINFLEVTLLDKSRWPVVLFFKSNIILTKNLTGAMYPSCLLFNYYFVHKYL